MIVPLGLWVLGEACRQATDWRERFPAASGLAMNVNLSVRQLLEQDLISRVAQILSETSMEPGNLVLEITEGSLMQEVGLTVAKLHALKELGTRLAIDDFGTGSSALGYLRQFPIDVLKIDKSFVDDLGQRSDASALVRTIIELAQSLRLGVVAEGIETAEQLAELRRAGCGSGQGYLFAKPLVREDIEDLLRSGARLAPAGSELDPSRVS
jgi:EAL domain-containing protein (putative c-di-GMP-specific phosphodiesterase class I)